MNITLSSRTDSRCAAIRLSDIATNAQEIVAAIGRESVEVYRFLSDEFARGPVSEKYVFQFTYRSFYRLDNAGLTPEFKHEYFVLLEEARNLPEINLPGLTRKLFAIPNLKGHRSLQFSFVSKLANAVNLQYPLYDAGVASVFGFCAPYNYKTFDVRLSEYMAFYNRLRGIYAEILDGNLLQGPRQMFRDIYAAPLERIPEIKVLDFIFWSAGKLCRSRQSRHDPDPGFDSGPQQRRFAWLFRAGQSQH